MKSFFNLPARADGLFNMLPNRLRDLIFVLFGYFDECVQFAEMDA
jgi:cobalamin biosynthesis protein CobD/CbiB